MNTEELKTWNFLKDFKLDDESSKLKFSDRLARENNWSKKFALACIDEYKKFVFLAKHAGHPVTPSVEVDEVWHLHMIYTRSYWKEMCAGINFDLHHGPTKGGAAENTKFTDWYTKTLESYKKFFGEPPSLCWPSKEKRFAPNSIKKVDTNKFFVFKKPSLSIPVATVCIIPLFVLMGLDAWFLLIAGIIFAIWGIARLLRSERTDGSRSITNYPYTSSMSSSKKKKKDSGSSNNDSGCSSGILSCGSSHSSSHSDSGHGGDSGCGSSCGSSCGGGCGGD